MDREDSSDSYISYLSDNNHSTDKKSESNNIKEETDSEFTNDNFEDNSENVEEIEKSKLIGSESFENSDTLSSEQITDEKIKNIETSNTINTNKNIENNCHNLFYYDINNNEINCLSNNEKICPDNYPYKSLIDNECQKYSLKYNNNRVNSIPNGTFIDTQYPNLDQCKDTNEIINEIGGFCITNKTNIISNIKIISESENNKMEICKGITFFFYLNRDNINELNALMI